jgi:hypothetical protein
MAWTPGAPAKTPATTLQIAWTMYLMTAFKMGFAFSVFVSVAFCQVPPMLTVHGINETNANFSATDLAKLPQQTVKTTDHGTPVNI